MPLENGQESFTLHVRLANGATLEQQVDNAGISVGELKQSLSARTGVQVARMRLMLESTILADDQSLESYGIGDGKVLRLVQLASNNSQDTPRNVNGISNANSEPSMLSPTEILSNQARQLMMANPQLAQAMMMANPQMREAIENNPELRQILTDPELMRRNMSAMQNPRVMQEMQRNNDRALSNLELSPGGYAHIRRMYKTVQEPLSRVADASTSIPLDELNRRRAQALGVTKPDSSKVNTTPLPNPWAKRRPQQNPQPGFDSRFPFSVSDQLTRSADRLAQLNISSSGSHGADQASQHQNLQQMLERMSRPVSSQNPFGFSPPHGQNGSLPFYMSNVQHAGTQSTLNNSSASQASVAATAGSSTVSTISSSSQPAAAAATAVTASASDDTVNVDALSESERSAFVQRFQNELEMLEEMGFSDKEKNLRALISTNGNLSLALNIIANVDDE
ncbi:hypothetical protein GGI12_002106 [Dipsacomyces acuminosporus]|nr:hypothetical protein GGI12_002106 [Dipsacomyces acuminosporus]